MNDLVRVRCAICDKPVDRLTVHAHRSSFDVTLVAECHGDEDTMILTDNFLAALSPEELKALQSSEGVAFATKRIGGGDD